MGKLYRGQFYTSRLSAVSPKSLRMRPRRVKIPKEELLACRYGTLRLGYLIKGWEVVDWLEVVDRFLVVLYCSILFYTFHRSTSKPC